ncbi:MAG: aconitate hydratase AcnA [Burkholderiales bacterium]|nr:aconitate hydratase AcnA [Burkholderiales bacterium]
MPNAGMTGISTATLTVSGKDYCITDLPALAGDALPQLPWVLRLLLENVARNMQGVERDGAVAQILGWLKEGRADAEIEFQPGRLLMHDTTSTPALVDVAGMRDALAEAGVDPQVLNPLIPVDVSIDHSLAVEAYARPDAVEFNEALEIRRNRERYRFLRWASLAMDNVRLHPPGTGIMHTINLEQLATVVTTETRDGRLWAVPDMMLGTDSHTPMINGIGVLGWGIGGLEAQTVMFGIATPLRIPDVVGVRLTGRLGNGVQASDLALVVTHQLRELDVTGDFVEFFGPGVSTLSAEDRAVVANMAPEYGATTGYFPPDARVPEYLRKTGRSEAAIALVEAYLQRNSLSFDPDAQPRYTRSIEIDLSTITLHAAGPRRPQDLLDSAGIRPALQKLNFQSKTPAPGLPRHPVALAAITSCTNTSNTRLLVAAGLVARKARALGIKPAPWVKTSLAPGSPAATRYLARTGLLNDLAAVGFGIVGFGCTTCIGNSGPLPEPLRDAQRSGTIKAVAMLSGNRNFPGRVHAELDLAFIMSPAQVVVWAFAGDAEKDLARDVIATTPAGQPVYLRDLWPGDAEIDALNERSTQAIDFKECFSEATANKRWAAIDAPDTPRFPWDATSNALRRPAFCSLAETTQLGRYSAHPLLVVGDDITTDHISPASAIPANSLVADYLVARGDDRNDLNVFASRRGNWEVMLRGAFYTPALRNLLKPDAPVAHTLHVPSGAVLPIHEAAQRYRDAGESVVLIAGQRYGMGSSRDWAAKAQRLLGIRAVLAVDFERIHRSNLIGMGVLPLLLPAGSDPENLQIKAGDRFEIDAPSASLAPRRAITVRLHRADGRSETLLTAAAVDTLLEVELLRAGGVIPYILNRSLGDTASPKTAGR